MFSRITLENQFQSTAINITKPSGNSQEMPPVPWKVWLFSVSPPPRIAMPSPIVARKGNLLCSGT